MPRIFGDYTAIKRDYPISEFADEAKAQGVTASVYVQINVAPGDEVWEAEWAAAEGKVRGLDQAVVAFCDLGAPSAPEVLDRLLEAAPVRGIRQQLRWHPEPLYRFHPDRMGSSMPIGKGGCAR